MEPEVARGLLKWALKIPKGGIGEWRHKVKQEREARQGRRTFLRGTMLMAPLLTTVGITSVKGVPKRFAKPAPAPKPAPQQGRRARSEWGGTPEQLRKLKERTEKSRSK